MLPDLRTAIFAEGSKKRWIRWFKFLNGLDIFIFLFFFFFQEKEDFSFSLLNRSLFFFPCSRIDLHFENTLKLCRTKRIDLTIRQNVTKRCKLLTVFFSFLIKSISNNILKFLTTKKRKKKRKKNPLEVVQTFSHQQQPTLFPLATVETQTDVS